MVCLRRCFAELCWGPSLQNREAVDGIFYPSLLLTPQQPGHSERAIMLAFTFFFFFLNWGELSPLHCCGDSINETDRWGQVRGGDSSWLPSYFCDPSLQKPAVMPGRLSKTDIQQWQIGHLNMTLDVPKPQLKLCQLFSVVYHRGRITVLEIGCVRSVSVSANEHLWPWKRSAEQWDDVVAVSFQ